MYLSPLLQSKSQLEVMRGKSHVPITKLINLELNLCQTTIYYNIYMITLVFFGYRVITLNQ